MSNKAPSIEDNKQDDTELKKNISTKEYEALRDLVKKGDAEHFFAYLDEHKISVDAKCRFSGEEACILELSYEENNVDIMKGLLERGANPNVGTDTGYVSKSSLVAAAVISGNYDMAKCLVDYGADVTAKANNSPSAIEEAVRRGNENMISLVRQDGKNDYDLLVANLGKMSADVKQKNWDTFTKLNVDFSVVDEKTGETPLFCAAAMGDIKDIQVLKEKGVDIYHKNKYGEVAANRLGVYLDWEKRAQFLDELGVSNPDDLKINYRADLRNNIHFKSYEKDPLKSYHSEVLAYTDVKGGVFGLESRIGNIYAYQYGEEKAQKFADRKDSDAEYIKGNTVAVNSVVLHEYVHSLHMRIDGMSDARLTDAHAVDLNACTEAVAHTAQCLNAVNDYQNLKAKGVTTFVYDNHGKTEERPIEDLLKMYSDELYKYVQKEGFDINDPKSVNAVAEIAVDSYWHKDRKKVYEEKGGQFDQHGSLSDLYKITTSDDEALKQLRSETVDRMLKDVPITIGGVCADFRGLKDKFDTMDKTDSFVHGYRALTGYDIDKEDALKIMQLTQSAQAEDYGKLAQFIEQKIGNKVEINDQKSYLNGLVQLMSHSDDGNVNGKAFLVEYVAQISLDEQLKLKNDLLAQKGDTVILSPEEQERQNKLSNKLKLHDLKKSKECVSDENETPVKKEPVQGVNIQLISGKEY